MWLDRLKAAELHVCIETTGAYGEALAQYLYGVGFQVGVVNPARIHGFSQGELMRAKTDKPDISLLVSAWQ